MAETPNKALTEEDLPRTPPGRPIAPTTSRRVKEPLDVCVERRMKAFRRQGIPRATAALRAIKECEKSRPLVNRPLVDTRKDLEKIGEKRRKGESLKDCVSRKIPLNMKEGRTRAQAVRISFEQCRLRRRSEDIK